jgi:hypothetical protein
MTMSSLRNRFATLERVPMPELWPDVQQRAARLGSAEPVTSVSVRIPVHGTGQRDRTLALVAAGALLSALLVGAIAVGSGLIKLPKIQPAPVATPSPAASPTSAVPLPSVSPAPSTLVSDGPSPWIVFSVGSAESSVDPRLWAMRADGSAAHEIAGGGPVAWSRDGTRLLSLQEGRIVIANVGADIGPFVDTGVKVPTNEQWEAFDFASDGERVVFMRKSKCPKDPLATGPSTVELATYVAETPGANCLVLSILDLRTGTRTDLDETLVKNQTANDGKTGSLELPAWAPDATRIAYSVADQPTPTADANRELWVVNADGAKPSRVELAANVSVREPRWSPDGTRISFTSESAPVTGAAESAGLIAELATGRLERITVESDPAARQLCCAEWLDNTHVRVKGVTDKDRFWVVALDASPPDAQLLLDLTESLATIPGSVTTSFAPGEPGRTFFWQPIPGRQP